MPSLYSVLMPAFTALTGFFSSNSTNVKTKSAQLYNLTHEYNNARNVLFDGYKQFENNETIARYSVRELCFSLLASIERAQKCGNYFDEILTDQTLTTPEIADLKKIFDPFDAQSKQDRISYKTSRPQEIFYVDQNTPPANVSDVVKVLHLVQYVINGYTKMISAETGVYPRRIIIDYTGGGGVAYATGDIRIDITILPDFINLLRILAHENGHLRKWIYNHQSSITIPSSQLPYVVPELLLPPAEPALKENEAEADMNAVFVASLCDVPFDHAYTALRLEPPLPAAQEAQDPHPSGQKRAALMQEGVSNLRHHFGDNLFGEGNIWQQFAQKVCNISGINFKQNIPTFAELLRIYNLSPNDKDQQIRTLEAEYPKLFTNTTRGDYPNPPLVAVGLDEQLASLKNWSLPFQLDRENTPVTSIEVFQERWDAAGGKLPFPALERHRGLSKPKTSNAPTPATPRKRALPAGAS